MTIPEGFIFSQGNLQDYFECQRRFQLKYLIERSWPALEAQPADDLEHLILLGHRFHQIIRQYIIGIPKEQVIETIDDDTLEMWWNDFLIHLSESAELNTILDENTQNYPEISITAPILNYQLTAKYDLISITSEKKFIIFDWKTSRRRPERAWLNKRMQTKIYPYLLVKAGNFLNSGNEINPEQIEMLYWYAYHPDRIEKFKYSKELHLANKDYLMGLIDEINQKQEGDYLLTPNKRTCHYCVYRSLCERGNKAGPLDDLSIDPEIDDEMVDFEFDIEQIAEIEF